MYKRTTSCMPNIFSNAMPMAICIRHQSHNMCPFYFPQDHKDGIGEDAPTLIEWLYRYAPEGTDTTVIRSMLGRMLFSGDMAQKSTTVLSGGEKSRLILSRMIMAEDNVLALDEPTNHLDLESIEALNYSLSIYEGTAIIALISLSTFVLNEVIL